MRLAKAIERYLQYARIERDFTARSLESYYRVLVKLDDAYPDTHVHDFEGREGKRRVLEVISAFSRGRRPNVVSIYHSFFRWLEAEDLLEDDRVRTIQRPPRRRADVYRPPAVDRELAFRVTTLHERAPWLLMDKVGLRASEVCALRWADVDLRLGEVHVAGKGGHRDVLPVIPEALDELRRVYTTLAPEPDHHVFTVEVEHWQGPNRIRKVRDPLRPARSNSLWGMVQRICKRAGIKPFGPHALRHAFATSFLRDSDRDVMSLQKLMRHSSLETTRGYVDELAIGELREVLERVSDRREESEVLPALDDVQERGERFWSNVDRSSSPNGCWIWTAGRDDWGYGWFRVGKVVCRAPMVAYALEHGVLPNRQAWPKELILHKCDTPECVRPDHLYIGSYHDNMRDRAARGRHTKEGWAVVDTPRKRKRALTSAAETDNTDTGDPQTESCARHDSNMRSEPGGSESAAASDSDPGLDPESEPQGGHK